MRELHFAFTERKCRIYLLPSGFQIRYFILLFSVVWLAGCPSSSPYQKTLSNIYEDAKKEGTVFAKHFSKEIDPQAIDVLQAKLKSKERPKLEQDGPKCVRAYWGKTVITGSVYFYFKTGDPTIIEKFESSGGISQAISRVMRHNNGPKKPNGLDACRIANGQPPLFE